MINLNPNELSKNMLIRTMNEFNVDIHKAFRMLIDGFDYFEGSIKRTHYPTTNSNVIKWYTQAYDHLKKEYD